MVNVSSAWTARAERRLRMMEEVVRFVGGSVPGSGQAR